MQHALGTKNKLVFINGSVLIPDLEDLNWDAWERCNHLIYSWLINSVSPQVAQTLVFHENAIDVWEELKERFAKVDRIHIASLHYSINNLKQGSKSVLEYFTEMKTLWEELNSHHPMPNCTCPFPCRCEAMRSARMHGIEDLVIQFLTGLNDNFNVIKSQVLLMVPLPSINKVYSLVIQEESNNCNLSLPSVLEDSSILANASDAKKHFGPGKAFAGPKNTSRFFTFCNRKNHTVEFCYQKHGYPNFYKPNSSANASSSGPANTQHVNSAIDNAPCTGLTQEHYNHILTLEKAKLVREISDRKNEIPHKFLGRKI
ncbi:putative retrotransposon gag domain-containing protein [Medicago truncatula]|uniref:Putative retrotransposon gag domain-containing protein n=1 Tax=Medicago truncatula TaxID=3880 RepID=A0A396JNL5_MEDTR|nr:putative retrotransposon gag domain-containing protein [Medicago truncatula]